MDIIDKIRLEMAKKNLDFKQLAQLTNINYFTVKNILLKRSNKLIYINKIAKVLNVSIESLLDKDLVQMVDLPSYDQASKICIDLLQRKQQLMAKTNIENFIYEVYKFICENGFDKNSCKAYALGVLNKYV